MSRRKTKKKLNVRFRNCILAILQIVILCYCVLITINMLYIPKASSERFLYTAAHIENSEYATVPGGIDLAIRNNPDFVSSIRPNTRVFVDSILDAKVKYVNKETFVVDVGNPDYIVAGLSGKYVTSIDGQLLGVVSKIAGEAQVECVALR